MPNHCSRILFVDDDAHLLDALQRSLRKQFDIETAVGGAEALVKLTDNGPFALVVVDMQMPEMSGLELLRRIQEIFPDCVRMMLTGNADLKTAVDAVNQGRVFRYLTKPCAPPDLVPVLAEGLEQYRVRFVERAVLENTLVGAVKVLTEVLASLDPSIFNRSQKLKEYVHAFAAHAKINSAWEIEMAAMLSHIGRVTIPRTIIDRISSGALLSPAEKSLLDQVPQFGAKLLENIPRLEYVATVVRYHQKHYDGSGFPIDDLREEFIPLGSRILKIFNDLLDFENLSMSRQEAFIKMQEFPDRYDPQLLMTAWDWSLQTADDTVKQRPVLVTELNELQIGQVLAEHICSREGMVILPAETKFTGMLLTKLNNFRAVNSIENSVMIYADVPPPP